MKMSNCEKLIIVCLTLFGAVILNSCQRPRLLQKESTHFTDFYTESVNHARQSYLAKKFPESWEKVDRASLRGMATTALLDVKGEIVLVTRNGYLHIIDPKDIEKQQTTKISPAISVAPTQYKDLLFIATELGKEGLKAYDLRRGKVIWSVRGELSKSSPLVIDNMVIHAGLNGLIRCLHSRTGKEIWLTDMKDKITSSLAADQGYVVAVSINGILRMFDGSSGAELWNLDLGEAVHTHPVIMNNQIFISSYAGEIYMFDLKKGNILNKLKTSTHQYHSVSVDEKNIYIPSSDGKITVLDKNSFRETWSVQLYGPPSTEILVTDNLLFCSTGQKLFYVIDKSNGRILNQISLKGRSKSLPMLLGDHLYLTFEHKFLSILSPAENKP